MASGFNTRGMGSYGQPTADFSSFINNSTPNRYGATRGGYGYVGPKDSRRVNFTGQPIANRTSTFRPATSRASGSSSGGSSNGGNQRVNDARRNMYDLAKAGYNEARDNPIDAMILDKLQGRSTTDVPYDEATINNLLAQGSEASAAAMENNQRQLDAMASRGGMDTTDPAYIAMQREANQNRLASNIKNRRAIQSDARIENYNAQGRGLSQLGAANQAYRNRIDSNSRNLQNLYSRENATSQGGNSGGAGNSSGGGSGGGYTRYVSTHNGPSAGARANSQFHANVAANTGRYPTYTPRGSVTRKKTNNTTQKPSGGSWYQRPPIARPGSNPNNFLSAEELMR